MSASQPSVFGFELYIGSRPWFLLWYLYCVVPWSRLKTNLSKLWELVLELSWNIIMFKLQCSLIWADNYGCVDHLELEATIPCLRVWDSLKPLGSPDIFKLSVHRVILHIFRKKVLRTTKFRSDHGRVVKVVDFKSLAHHQLQPLGHGCPLKCNMLTYSLIYKNFDNTSNVLIIYRNISSVYCFSHVTIFNAD